jgi:AcrR family transcriptional regulator
VIIINKREESKIKTRALILENTKELIKKGGILSLTTTVIAKECKIAHGSIFQHFGSKENLINSLLEQEMKRLALKVKDNCNLGYSLQELLESYLKVLSEEEDFISRLYREQPLLPEIVQDNMVALEAIFRNAFFQAISKECDGREREKLITIKLDALFATIIRYLSVRELYAPAGEVIRTKHNDIKKLFEILFKEEL